MSKKIRTATMKQIKLVNTYKLYLKQKEEELVSQCFNFSLLSPENKFKLDKYVRAEKDTLNNAFEDPVYDNYIMLKKLLKHQKSSKKPPRHFDRFSEDEIYTYSINSTRQFLYLCKKKNIDIKKLKISIIFEQTNLLNPAINLDNIKEVVAKSSIDYIVITPES